MGSVFPMPGCLFLPLLLLSVPRLLFLLLLDKPVLLKESGEMQREVLHGRKVLPDELWSIHVLRGELDSEITTTTTTSRPCPDSSTCGWGGCRVVVLVVKEEEVIPEVCQEAVLLLAPSPQLLTSHDMT